MLSSVGAAKLVELASGAAGSCLYPNAEEPVPERVTTFENMEAPGPRPCFKLDFS